ncbi:outer membrane exchange accessory lipoprotein TraC [Myxococcaceae bacterium GXIMD 01537]
MHALSRRCSAESPSRRWLGALALLCLFVLAGCSAYGRAVKEGDTFSSERKWAEAEAAYQRALTLDPSASEVTLKLRALRKAWSEEVYAQAESVHASGDLPGAQKLLLRALELDGESEPVRALLARTLDGRVEVAQGLLKAEKLNDARAEFEAVLAVAPEHPAARKGVDQVQVAWAKRWFTTAQNLEKEGKLGNALLAYVRADQERVGATAARESAESVRNMLREEVAFLVVASPVDDRANAPDVAQRLAAGRVAAMLPKELPLRVVTEAPPQRVGVRLSLALERVMPVKAVEDSQRTQRYVVGNKSVPNPKRSKYEANLLRTERELEEVERRQAATLRDYLRLQSELTAQRQSTERCRERERKACREAIKECGEAARELEKPGTLPEECNPALCGGGECVQEEQLLVQKVAAVVSSEKVLSAALEKAELQRRDVQRQRDLVYREPLTVDEPMHSDFVYDVQLNRITVKATVTAVVQDLLAQTVPAPNTLDYAATHEDVSHKGYDRYGVLADPLQLRNELELRVEAGDKATADIAKRVMERFDVYRQKRVEDARRGMVRPSAEDVVETAVRALLLTADAPPQDILLPIAQARGLTRPESLLGL